MEAGGMSAMSGFGSLGPVVETGLGGGPSHAGEQAGSVLASLADGTGVELVGPTHAQQPAAHSVQDRGLFGPGWGPQQQRLALQICSAQLGQQLRGQSAPNLSHTSAAQTSTPAAPPKAAPSPAVSNAGAAASTGPGPSPDKYTSTCLVSDPGRVINQSELLTTITSPGAGKQEVTELFTFWRPAPCKSRPSPVLSLDNKQLDIMYAVAGCADVMSLVRNVLPPVRKALFEVYHIDKQNFAIWFKNRGRNPSKGNTRARDIVPQLTAQISDNPRVRKQQKGAGNRAADNHGSSGQQQAQDQAQGQPRVPSKAQQQQQQPSQLGSTGPSYRRALTSPSAYTASTSAAGLAGLLSGFAPMDPPAHPRSSSLSVQDLNPFTYNPPSHAPTVSTAVPTLNVDHWPPLHHRPGSNGNLPLPQAVVTTGGGGTNSTHTQHAQQHAQQHAPPLSIPLAQNTAAGCISPGGGFSFTALPSPGSAAGPASPHAPWSRSANDAGNSGPMAGSTFNGGISGFVSPMAQSVLAELGSSMPQPNADGAMVTSGVSLPAPVAGGGSLHSIDSASMHRDYLAAWREPALQVAATSRVPLLQPEEAKSPDADSLAAQFSEHSLGLRPSAVKIFNDSAQWAVLMQQADEYQGLDGPARHSDGGVGGAGRSGQDGYSLRPAAGAEDDLSRLSQQLTQGLSLNAVLKDLFNAPSEIQMAMSMPVQDP